MKKRYYSVPIVHNWSTLTIGGVALPDNLGKEEPAGFMAVFTNKRLAKKWAKAFGAKGVIEYTVVEK